MGERGFSVVALDSPKDAANVGGALRASWIYGAALVVLGGNRPKVYMGHQTDTTKGWRHTPHILVDDVFDALPHDCVPVAVDKVDRAVPLWDFHHPERAFYVFGPEDGTLGDRILSRCARRVFVPMIGCMNLAASVNVVLYDRLAKAQRALT
jgi:tRNA(Leu) C34 or U34 (ribose-2'-O)-methylase TrmL